jgi:hypothetical protein
MLSVIYAECRYAECLFAVSVVMLNVVPPLLCLFNIKVQLLQDLLSRVKERSHVRFTACVKCATQ